MEKKRSELFSAGLELGKIPPQAVEIEVAILGAILLEPSSLMTIYNTVNADMFYKEAHQKIYAAIAELYNDSKPVDQLTVIEKLKDKADLEFVGGHFYIAQLTTKIGSSSNIETHAQILAEKYMLREIIRLSQEMIHKSYKEVEDVLDLYDEVQQQVAAVGDVIYKDESVDLRKLSEKVCKDIKESTEKGELIDVIPTGFKSLDDIIGGLEKKRFYTFAGRPGMGKTVMAMSMVHKICIERKVPTLVINMEMGDEELFKIFQGYEANISKHVMKYTYKMGKKDLEKLEKCSPNIYNSPLQMICRTGVEVNEFKSIARKAVLKHGVELIVVDYLQRMKVGGNFNGNRVNEVSKISNAMKDIAVELDVPVVALAQLSRTVESRGGNKKPQLSDLKDSGSIEEDSDTVIFPFRPGYYHPKNDDGSFDDSTAEFLVAKQRSGKTDSAKVVWNTNIIKFENERVDDDSTKVEGLPF